MKLNSKHFAIRVVIASAMALPGWNMLGLGMEYPNDRAVNEPSWPSAMSQLVNTTNRIGGFFENQDDVFFFSGTISDFNAFLTAYLTVEPIEKHRLIFHDGNGQAFSLGGGNKRPCDWKLEGWPAAWRDAIEGNMKTPRDTNYVLEVDFWTGGKIAVAGLVIPPNIEVAGDCFKNFESINAGMTRAEVEKRLLPDGGLQSVSPVRFIDTNCPGFKVNIDFEVHRDAADQNRAVQSKDDKVLSVSKPYVERPFTD